MVDFPGHIAGGQPNIGALAAQPPIEVETTFAPEDIQRRKGKWLEFFQTPQVQAALLQFGVSALQPRAPGQSTAGALASAVGEGAEAAGRVTAGQQARTQQAATLGLQERRVGAVETQAATGQEQLRLSQQRITNQAGQFTRTLEQQLGIARGSALSKMATSLMTEEMERADLAGEAPNFAGIAQQVVAMQRALEGGEAAPVAAFDPSTLTSEDIKGSFDRAIAAGQTSEQVKKRMIEGGITQGQLDAALATGEAGEKAEELPSVPAPNAKELARLESAPKATEDAEDLAALYPKGVEDISEEDFAVIRDSRYLRSLFNTSFGRAAFNTLTQKFRKKP